MRRLGPLFSLLLFFPIPMASQEKDPHFLTPRIATTAHRSTFVHGYLHGYEEGFHEADFDLHMGRIARGEYARDPAPTGYRKQFGPKLMYASGYHQGFRVGYADVVAERSFRAVENAVSAIEPENTAPDQGNWTFDQGVRLGYLAGQHQGPDDARNSHKSKPSPACPIGNEQAKQEFCAAYASGFDMGYADGLVNQAKTVVAEAKK